MPEIKIAPSILSADFSALGEAVRVADQGGADYIHVDVMDGHFVPNITIGAGVVKAIRPHTQKPLDVHLMIAPCDAYIQDFADAGADIITIHAEAGAHTHRSLQAIQATGKKVGLAVNPATPLSILDSTIEMLDLILVMTVNPGFGGQGYIPSEARIKEVRKRVRAVGKPIDIQVDGGITPDTAPRVKKAGANVLVAGTAVYGNGLDNVAESIRAIREA